MSKKSKHPGLKRRSLKESASGSTLSKNSNSEKNKKMTILKSQKDSEANVIYAKNTASVASEVPIDFGDIIGYEEELEKQLREPEWYFQHMATPAEELPCCSSEVRYYEKKVVEDPESSNTCGTKRTTAMDFEDPISLLDESLSEAMEEEEEKDLCLNCERKRVIASEEYYDILIDEQYEEDEDKIKEKKSKAKERKERKVQKYRCRVCGYARKERKTIRDHVEKHFEKEEIYYCFDCQKRMNKITLDSLKDPKHKNRLIQITRKEQMNKPPTMRKMSVIPRCAECDCIFDYLFSAIQKLVDCYEYSYVDDYGNLSTIAMYFCRFCHKERRYKHFMENHVFNHLLANEILCKPCRERKDKEKEEAEKEGKDLPESKKKPWIRSHKEEDLVPKAKTEEEEPEKKIAESKPKRKHRSRKKKRGSKSKKKEEALKKKEPFKEKILKAKEKVTEDKENKKAESKPKGKSRSKKKRKDEATKRKSGKK